MTLTFCNLLPKCQEVHMAAQMTLTDAEFTSAVELLRKLIPEDDFPAYSLELSPATVYTTLVTLWMLTLQRLGGGQSLEAIVNEVLTNNRSLLPDNKRVREGTLSFTSGAYSRARTRLPIETVQSFAQQVSQSLIDLASCSLGGRRRYILDGTTMTLAPTSSPIEAYPPATNQHGETVWPVMMLMVAHELESGCALISEFGPMYGPNRTSEAKQAAAIAGRIPSGSLVLADAGFGIFSVAWAMVAADHDILFRLTKSRFKALVRRAEMIDSAAQSSRYRLTWTPSAKDRHTNPELPAQACLEVFLHQVELAADEYLYLVTTLPISSELAAEYYSRRYDVEHDIRDVKVSMGIENIRAKSDEMVQKELLSSVVAYNLVLELRREVAKVAGVQPRRLSFTGVWTTMQNCLLRQPPCAWSEWQERYETAVRIAATYKLPNRPGRTYPRRPKSTKFMQTPTKPLNLNTVPEKPK
jgi:Transposase DDE domain